MGGCLLGWERERARERERAKRGKWRRVEGGRKLGSREGLSISLCSTGVFKYHHRVWLRHEGWESSADQRLFKQLSLALSFCIFFFPTVVLWLRWVADSLVPLDGFETMKGEISPTEMLITHTIMKTNSLIFLQWCCLPFCCSFAVFSLSNVEIQLEMHNTLYVSKFDVGVFMGENAHSWSSLNNGYLSFTDSLPSWRSKMCFFQYDKGYCRNFVHIAEDKSHKIWIWLFNLPIAVYCDTRFLVIGNRFIKVETTVEMRKWKLHAAYKYVLCVFVGVSAGIRSAEDNSHWPGSWPTERHRLHHHLRSVSHNQSDIHSTERGIDHFLS